MKEIRKEVSDFMSKLGHPDIAEKVASGNMSVMVGLVLVRDREKDPGINAMLLNLIDITEKRIILAEEIKWQKSVHTVTTK